MKKILFATTALVVTAGFASAGDIKLSGSAEMGIYGGDNNDTSSAGYGNAIETQFESNIDVTFKMSGESDNGLSFGAQIDLDEATKTKNSNETVWISAGGATFTMGDTDGAFDKALTEVAIGAAIKDDHSSHAGYNGNSGLDGTYDGQIARFDYAFSDVTVSASVEMDDTGVNDPVWGLGVAYSFDAGGVDLGVGLGYQATDKAKAIESILGLSLSAKMDNGFEARVNYSDMNGGTGVDGSHWGIGLGYSMNALTLSANYGEYDNKGGVAGADDSGWGVAAKYDMGGGLSAQFGYGHGEQALTNKEADTWSLGLAMSF